MLVGGCRDGDRPAAGPYRVGLLPDESAERVRAKYAPLIAHLATHTGVALELVIPADYGEILALFRDGKIDFARLGGLTFIQAHLRHDAVPMVFRDTDVHFKSYFVARADDPRRSVEDFAGASFAFGSTLSTSGHLMPRHFMLEMGIEPEDHFGDVRYADAHDRTVGLVRDRQVDLGVANGRIVDGMLADGRLSGGDVRILWKTPPYPDNAWAAQASVPPDVRRRIVAAFLELDPSHPEQGRILDDIDAGGYLPARVEDFQELIDGARELGLL